VPPDGLGMSGVAYSAFHARWEATAMNEKTAPRLRQNDQPNQREQREQRDQREQRREAPMRILVADEDPVRRRVMASLIVDKLDPAIAIEAGDVPSALEALLTLHPDFVFADLGLPGHVQGGFRLVLDAASLGVAAVVTSGPIARALELRLTELKIGWVPKGASESALFAVISHALELRQSSRRETLATPPLAAPNRPRLHTA
jgi:CheY-like chemotaxis protein